MLTAMAWLSLGPDIGQLPDRHRRCTTAPRCASLRERIAEQYSAPFDAIFDSPQAAAELGDVDRTMAFALLIGPLAFGRISTLADFDYQRSRSPPSTGSSSASRRTNRRSPAASSESAGA